MQMHDSLKNKFQSIDILVKRLLEYEQELVHPKKISGEPNTDQNFDQ